MGDGGGEMRMRKGKEGEKGEEKFILFNFFIE